jgi:beta-N-acetylhexosaminidase
MTLEQKIGQMLIAGFRGLSYDENSTISKAIRKGQLGGVILFDRDVQLASDIRNIESPEQVAELNRGLKSQSEQPLFVSVDQEGGTVCRLKERNGFPPTVSLEYLGQKDDLELTRTYARETAVTLKKAGFNLNFAPCVDLNLNPDNPIIGSRGRSISREVSKVVRHATVIVDECRSNGIIAVLKHYPGHGSSKGDSHHGFVDVTDIWQLKELSTFRDLIDLGRADMIMTAHIFNENYDKKYPATLSKGWLKGILRFGLDFDGVIISDDMQMKAITNDFGLEESLMLSVNAGIDILCFANNVDYDDDIIEKVNEILIKHVRDGRISVERIDESIERILKIKQTII